MELCLVRHAIAVERGSSEYPDDASRPLTDEGRERMERGARGLAWLWTPELIVSSPLVRALETAAILQAALGDPPIRYSEALANGDHGELFDDLRDHRRESIAVVGHEPWLSELLSCSLSASPRRMHSDFKKGGAALVTFPGARMDAGTALLNWFLTPSVLRKLGRGKG
jgi:phosphohistidine phosphatase